MASRGGGVCVLEGGDRCCMPLVLLARALSLCVRVCMRMLCV